MGNELAAASQQNGALSADVLTPERIELLKRTVCRGASDDEFALFVSVANRAGLDPFSRQIHAVRRGNAMTIQTGIDGYRLIAQRSGQYAGQDDIVYDTEDGAHPNTARCTVYRFSNGQRVGTTKTARWREYAQESGPMWRKMPWCMLGKCAEALALRAAFPQELSGLYTSEEMDQADAPPPPASRPQRKQAPIAERIRKPAAPVVDSPPAEDWPPDDQGASEPPQDEPASPPAFNRAACLHDLMEESVRGVVSKAAKALGLKLAVSADLKAMPDADLVRLHDAAFNNPLI